MADLIDRRAAIDALKEHRALFCDNTPNTFSKLSYAEKSRVDELDMAIATLINMPSAQPEIIRCKECKFYTEMRPDLNTGICSLACRHLGGDGFCSEAERKTMSDLISAQEAVAKIVDTAIQKISSGEQKLTKEYEQSVEEAVNVILNTARRTNG